MMTGMKEVRRWWFSFIFFFFNGFEQYFNHEMHTLCGIPNITLRGTLQDWKNVRSRAEQLLNKLVLPEFANMWKPVLLPVLDEFVNAYEGKVNAEFWQSCCKRYQVLKRINHLRIKLKSFSKARTR